MKNNHKNVRPSRYHQIPATPHRGQGTIEYVGRPGGSVPLARPGPRPLYDFTRKPINKTRGQGTIEYVFMLGGALLIVSLTAYFLMNNVLAPQTKTLGNQSDQVKDFKKQLQQQTQATQPTIGPSPTPTPTATPTSTPTSTPTATPTATPTITPTATPTPTPTPTATPSATPTINPTACSGLSASACNANTACMAIIGPSSCTPEGICTRDTAFKACINPNTNNICPGGTYKCPTGSTCRNALAGEPNTKGFVCVAPDTTWKQCGNGQACYAGHICIEARLSKAPCPTNCGPFQLYDCRVG